MPNILSCVGEEEEKAEFEVDLNMTTTLVKLKVVAVCFSSSIGRAIDL